MTQLILPRRLSSQPQGGVSVDWANPLNTSVLAAAPLSSDIGREIVAGVIGTVSGATRTTVRDGRAARLVRASSQYIEFPLTSVPAAFSVELMVRVGAAAGALCPVAIGNAARTEYRGLLLRSDSVRQIQVAGVGSGAVFTANATAGSQYVAGNYLHLIATFNSNQASGWGLFINGIQASLTPTNANTLSAIVPAYLQIGRSTTTDYFDGDIYNVIVHKRVLSATEARQRAANPWQIFKAPSRQLFAANDAGVAGVTGSIAAVEPSDTLAATASVSVTGSASWTEDADAAALSGSVVAGASATIAWTEASDTAALSGSATVTGSASWTEAPDTTAITAAVAVPVTGAVSWTEEDTTSISGVSAAAGQPMIGGGASGNIREVRRFAQLLADARRPTKAQKKRRKQEIQREVLELLPDLPQAEEVAPIIAQKVYAQEARIADITRRAMPSQVLQPVVVPFDAQSEIARMVEEWARNEAIRRELEDEEDIEFLLMAL